MANAERNPKTAAKEISDLHETSRSSNRLRAGVCDPSDDSHIRYGNLANAAAKPEYLRGEPGSNWKK